MEKQYYGIIQDITITNYEANIGIETPFLMTERDVKMVHYPDCQQLIIWLPDHGRNYAYLILVSETEEIIQKSQMGNVLQGSNKLILDTLPLAPGNYSLQMTKENGIKHEIHFRKYTDLTESPLQQKAKPEVEGNLIKGQYRDGTGNPITDQDLLHREKLFQDLTRKVLRKLDYSGNVRSGSVEYIDGEIKLTFMSEMGSGNCMFYIIVPSEKEWEESTKTPLEKRSDILDFIAQTAKRDYASNGRYEISETHIGFYYE